jgi:hypothetical protein
MQPIAKITESRSMKNKLFFTFFLSILLCYCSSKKITNDPINVTLLNLFVDDTILYRKLSFKLEIQNNLDKELTINLERDTSIIGNRNLISNPNYFIYLKDSAKGKYIELLLSSIFPADVIIRPKSKLDILLVTKCNDCSFTKSNCVDRSGFENAIFKLIKNDLYLIHNNSQRYVNKVDTSVILIDSKFTIFYREAFVRDFNHS